MPQKKKLEDLTEWERKMLYHYFMSYGHTPQEEDKYSDIQRHKILYMQYYEQIKAINGDPDAVIKIAHEQAFKLFEERKTKMENTQKQNEPSQWYLVYKIRDENSGYIETYEYKLRESRLGKEFMQRLAMVHFQHICEDLPKNKKMVSVLGGDDPPQLVLRINL